MSRTKCVCARDGEMHLHDVGPVLVVGCCCRIYSSGRCENGKSTAAERQTAFDTERKWQAYCRTVTNNMQYSEFGHTGPGTVFAAAALLKYVTSRTRYTDYCMVRL
eukprot:TRINITY_DN3682_c0_g2_i1.p3 TRINITY_DN3682_c0_g2~~TRINITY_DN3682_c0_g2_i1.p3  ORF type:complete len:106 (+),score=1.60 TRINITY_DN3682_c0_g2_i1:314-631(+)